MSDDIEKDLKDTKDDYVHTVVKAAISSVPVVGSALGEFFFYDSSSTNFKETR